MDGGTAVMCIVVVFGARCFGTFTGVIGSVPCENFFSAAVRTLLLAVLFLFGTSSGSRPKLSLVIICGSVARTIFVNFFR